MTDLINELRVWSKCLKYRELTAILDKYDKPTAEVVDTDNQEAAWSDKPKRQAVDLPKFLQPKAGEHDYTAHDRMTVSRERWNEMLAENAKLRERPSRKELIDRIDAHLSKRYKSLTPDEDKYFLYRGLLLDFVMSNTPPVPEVREANQ